MLNSIRVVWENTLDDEMILRLLIRRRFLLAKLTMVGIATTTLSFFTDGDTCRAALAPPLLRLVARRHCSTTTYSLMARTYHHVYHCSQWFNSVHIMANSISGTNTIKARSTKRGRMAVQHQRVEGSQVVLGTA
jgi:hypothetical protein